MSCDSAHGMGWMLGQNIEIALEDMASPIQGRSQAVTVTAGGGNFIYQFNLAPWFENVYTNVFTGEWSEARPAFTDDNVSVAVSGICSDAVSWTHCREVADCSTGMTSKGRITTGATSALVTGVATTVSIE